MLFLALIEIFPYSKADTIYKGMVDTAKPQINTLLKGHDSLVGFKLMSLISE